MLNLRNLILTLFILISQFDASAMQYKKICRSSKDCKLFSKLVMGTDHLVQENWINDSWPETTTEELFEILDEAAKLGINFFDTSPIYVGGIEYKLGQWLTSRESLLKFASFYENSSLNPDKQAYVLSKGGFPFDLSYSQELEVGLHSAELINELKEIGSLQIPLSISKETLLTNVPAGTYASRLFGTIDSIKKRVLVELGHTSKNLNGKITMYLMHRDDADFVNFKEIKRQQTSVTNIMKALSSFEVSDQFWGLGWSNWRNKRVNKSVTISKSNENLLKPLINSPYFSLFEMSRTSIHAGGIQVTHEEMMDDNFQKGINIMPYSPLGGFSIFDKPAPVWENARKAAKLKYDNGDPYWQNVYKAIFTKENEKRYYRVVQFTSDFNKIHHTSYTLDQMINAYALAHPRTDLLAIGPVTIEQLRRTVQSLELAKLLTPKDLDYLHSGKI
jgi:aryl-alcohol dehydrogenase-like predicted oxidoreductase